MVIVWSEEFRRSYCRDPAAERGRVDLLAEALLDRFPSMEASPASFDEARLVHTPGHISALRKKRKVANAALLALGATISASQLALRGQRAFALVRPPGHHASPDDAWGFCYLNNVAIAVEAAIRSEAVKRVLIVDFDLHHGDGTEAAFRGRLDVTYVHPEAGDRRGYLDALRSAVDEAPAYDLLAVSAGFDRHVDDWGEMLRTEDYRSIGKLLCRAAEARCEGRLFAALEGGYDPKALRDAGVAFLSGVA